MLPAMLTRGSLWAIFLLHFAASAYAVDCRRQESGDQTHVVCRALYLDGSVSSLLAPALGREDSRKGLGPIFAMTREPGAATKP